MDLEERPSRWVKVSALLVLEQKKREKQSHISQHPIRARVDAEKHLELPPPKLFVQTIHAWVVHPCGMLLQKEFRFKR